MQTYTIKLPTFDNDNIPFPKEAFEEFEAFLLKLFGAFSGPSIPMKGVWQADSGDICTDYCTDYFISCNSVSQGMLFIFVAAFVLVNFRQKAVWVSSGTVAEVVTAEAIAAAVALLTAPLIGLTENLALTKKK